MCEIGPGVYTAPRMTQGVRRRVWAVLSDWFTPTKDSSIVMTWPNPQLPGGQGIATLGLPAKELCDHNGVFLVRRRLADEAPAANSLTSNS